MKVKFHLRPAILVSNQQEKREFISYSLTFCGLGGKLSGFQSNPHLTELLISSIIVISEKAKLKFWGKTK
jgi:hypothetical protein